MPKHKIQIVEDESIVAKDIQVSLENLGYEVVAKAVSGREAIRQAEQFRPDLVIMDIVLQGKMDGIESAGEIRSRLNIPVIFLTAYADDKTIERAKLTEPFGYLIKPFDERELQTCVQMALYKHRQEKTLLESRNWLLTLVRCMGEAVVAVDSKARVTFLNAVAQSLTGWEEKEATGKPLNDVVVLKSGATGERMSDPAARTLSEGITVFLDNDTLLVRKNRSEVPVGDSMAPIKDASGKIVGAVLVFQDVSESRKTEATVKSAGRLLPGFISATSRNLQTSLRKIVSFGEILNEKYKDLLDPQGKFYLHRLNTASQRMVEHLQGIARLTEAEHKERPIVPLDLNVLVAKVVSNMKNQIDRVGGQVTVSDLPTLKVDGFQMRQVFQNLLDNALKYGKPAVAPRVRIGSRRVGADGKYWEIFVEDNGAGFDEERRRLVFQPPARLKGGKQPSERGVGLILCRKIIKYYGGTLAVESQPGEGSVFLIRLPAD